MPRLRGLLIARDCPLVADAVKDTEAKRRVPENLPAVSDLSPSIAV
jgi:hypothetical protein